MATYRVFQKINAKENERAFGEDIKFVRDGFSFLALIFPILWLLINRLWLAFAIYILLLSIIILLGIHYHSVFPFLLNNIPGLYLAFEGQNIVARKLVFLGYREIDILHATNLEEAEAQFFQRYAVTENNHDRQRMVAKNFKNLSTEKQALHRKAPLIGGVLPPSRGL